MDVVAVFAIALVAAVVGVTLGMLAAPSVGRLADRVGRSDDEDRPDDGDGSDGDARGAR